MKLKTLNKDEYIITGVAAFIGSTLLPALIKKRLSKLEYINFSFTDTGSKLIKV